MRLAQERHTTKPKQVKLTESVKADIVIWPKKFMVAENNLETLYAQLENSTDKIQSFLEQNGIGKEVVSFSAPFINDKLAQQYGDQGSIKFPTQQCRPSPFIRITFRLCGR